MPEVSYSMQNIINGTANDIDYRVVYGQQGHEYDQHKTGYTVERLTEILKNVRALGKKIDIEVTETLDPKGMTFKNIVARVKKVRHPKYDVLAEMWDGVNEVIEDPDRLLQRDGVKVVPSNGKANGTREAVKPEATKKSKVKVNK